MYVNTVNVQSWPNGTPSSFRARPPVQGVPQGMVQHATPQAIPGDKQVVTPGVTQNAAHTIPICPVYRTMPTSFDSMPPPPNLMPPMVPGNLGPQFLMSGNQMPYSEPVYPPTSMAAPPTQQQEQQQQQQFVSINNAGMPIMPAYADGCAPPLPQNFANDSPRQPQSLSQKLTPPSRASSVSISPSLSKSVPRRRRAAATSIKRKAKTNSKKRTRVNATRTSSVDGRSSKSTKTDVFGLRRRCRLRLREAYQVRPSCFVLPSQGRLDLGDSNIFAFDTQTSSVSELSKTSIEFQPFCNFLTETWKSAAKF